MRRRAKLSLIGMVALTLLFLWGSLADAAIISGDLSGSGSLVLTNGVVTFTNSGPVGGGIFVVDPSSTGFWASLAVTTATLQPLSAAIEPPGVPVNIPNWITFSAAPTVSGTLNLVLSGIYSAAACGAAPAAGQSCTPPGTPFNFTNLTATSSIGSFGLQGTIVDTASPGQTSGFSAGFTFQYPKSYQNVLAIAGGGGSLPTTYSASFTTTPNDPAAPVPEPATLLLLGSGFAALAAWRRRRT
jgi:PEP-CTERM motif-containing protein